MSDRANFGEAGLPAGRGQIRQECLQVPLDLRFGGELKICGRQRGNIGLGRRS